MALATLDSTNLVVGNYVIGRVLITGPGARMVENYQFGDDTPAIILAKMARIIQARRRLLAGGFQIEDAMFSYVNPADATTKGDGYPAVTAPVDPVNIFSSITSPSAQETTPEPCNNPAVGLLFRFQGTNGHFETRLIRGVRDSWINGDAAAGDVAAPSLVAPYASGGPYLGGTAPDPTYTDATDAPADQLRNYLGLVRDNCSMFRPLATTPVTFQRYNFLFYTYSEIASRQVGVVSQATRGRQRSFA